MLLVHIIFNSTMYLNITIYIYTCLCTRNYQLLKVLGGPLFLPNQWRFLVGWKHFAKLGDHISPPFTRKPATSIENMSTSFEVNSASCRLMVRDFCHTLPLDLEKKG